MITLKELALLESLGMSAGSALLRGKKKTKKKKPVIPEAKKESAHLVSESLAEVLEASAAVTDDAGSAVKGPVVKAILISEGIGNPVDMNYYSREAIEAAPAVFEGEPMMMDHMSYSEDKDRPEGSVRKTVGYYKNVRAEMVEGLMTLSADLHFDLSPDGQAAYQKALTAIQYKKDFPGSDKEYIGVSVNAEGESEPREMTIDGQMMEVNYVTRFTRARSADMVTRAGARGRIVALMEDVFGARMKNKEVRMKTVERIKAALAALTEAQSEKDPDLRTKKISEAQKGLESLNKEIEAAAAKAKKEAAGKTDADESTDESEAEKTDSAPTDDDVDEDDGATHEITHKVKSTGAAAVAAAGGKKEADKKILSRAIKSMIQESGLSEKHLPPVEELVAMGYDEAEKEIARTKRISEANAAAILKSIGSDVFAAHGVKLTESGKSERSNDDEFASLSL